MSTSYFISPINPLAWKDVTYRSELPVSDLYIDHVQYRQQLLRRWPNAEVVESTSPLMLLSWDLFRAGMEGHLHSDHQNVSFKAGKGLVDFVLWHRAFISANYTLFLSRDSSWDSLELSAATAEQEIVDFLGFHL